MLYTRAAYDSSPELDVCALVGLVVESFGFGIFLVSLIQCLEAIAERRRAGVEAFTAPLVGTALILFLAISAHWGIELSRAFDGFIFAHDNQIQNLKYSGALNLAPKSVASAALYVSIAFVGDAFMVYRLFIVWNRNLWVIFFPMAFCIALAVTGSATVWVFVKDQGSVFDTARPWIASCLVLTLSCNLITTGLIALRIHLSTRNDAPSPPIITKVFNIVVQSGLLLSASLATTLGLFLGRSNALYVLVCMNSPLVGIIFCVIVSRSHRAAIHQQQQQQQNEQAAPPLTEAVDYFKAGHGHVSYAYSGSGSEPASPGLKSQFKPFEVELYERRAGLDFAA